MTKKYNAICKIENMFENGMLNTEFINQNYRSFRGWECDVSIPMVDDWSEKQERLICVANDHFTFLSGFHIETVVPQVHINIIRFDVQDIPEGEWVWKRMRTRGDWKLSQWKVPKTDIRHYLKRQFVVPLMIAECEREAELLKEWCIID